MDEIGFEGFKFRLHPQVYPPAEDSFLLARNLEVPRGARVLDMGTGCGIQGIVASSRADEVLAVDINPHAVSCARGNCKINGVSNMEVVEGDLFHGIAGSFDLITFNPPYLPPNPEDPPDLLQRAWDGGEGGREVTDRFISGLGHHLAEGGRVLLVQSSLNDPERTVSSLEAQGLETRIIAEERFFFERLYLLEASRKEEEDGKKTCTDLQDAQEAPLY
jgi:release factor glutamine methyltransferase